MTEYNETKLKFVSKLILGNEVMRKNSYKWQIILPRLYGWK
jgi:hypothetical protein